jgi:hypothetical protein
MARFEFFVYSDDRFLLDVIIVIITTFSIKRQSIFHDYHERETTGEIEKRDGGRVAEDRNRRGGTEGEKHRRDRGEAGRRDTKGRNRRENTEGRGVEEIETKRQRRRERRRDRGKK